ncbi:Endonuclease/exonuclease/phosphatase, partial [Hysterangium stoloniferum]
IRVLSFNLRYDSQPDTTSVSETIRHLPDPLTPRSAFYANTNERKWSERRIAVANEVLFNKVDLIGFQEALLRQVSDLQELLGDEWDHRGVARDDGKEAGEFGPIFWNKSVLDLQEWDTFWLSHTPFDAGSRYPGAGSVRICTVARFKHAAGEVTVMAAHWDERSDAQRQLAASLILHRAQHEALRTHAPVVLLGDFNAPAAGRDSAGYEIITGCRVPVSISDVFRQTYSVPGNAAAFAMVDLLGEAPRRRVSGNYATYTGFNRVQDSKDFGRIDFIMGGSNRGWEVLSYRVGQALYDDGMYESDHRPVFCDIVF